MSRLERSLLSAEVKLLSASSRMRLLRGTLVHGESSTFDFSQWRGGIDVVYQAGVGLCHYVTP